MGGCYLLVSILSIVKGKLIAYDHAGEIYFVATHDTVYFEIKRHY